MRKTKKFHIFPEREKPRLSLLDEDTRRFPVLPGEGITDPWKRKRILDDMIYSRRPTGTV